MKQTTIALAVTAALLVVNSAAAGDFDGGYIGGKIGSSRSDTSGLQASSRSSATTYGLEGGYGWDMGQTTLGVNGFYDSNRQSNHAPLGQLGSRVYGLGLKLGLPINSLMPYAKLGYGHATGIGAISNFGASSVNGGLGLEYKFAPNWSVAGEWTAISPSNNGTKLNNDNFSIGVNYYFAAPKAAPASAPAAQPVMSEAPEAAPAPQPKEAWKVIMEEKPVRIEGASFDTNSAKLKPTAATKLQQVVDFAGQYPDANLEVNGYTDDRGSKTYNLKLSQRRADSVKAYLVKKGVAADRISTKGYGVDNPVSDNKTKAGRAMNRRVEVHYTVREEKKVRVTE
ncbi:MAG: OmpA family protein [Sideroxydans sp.]|nr:OmpA family protein [Sideroxydans sp.]